MNTNPAPQAASGPAPEMAPAVPGWVHVFLTFLRLWSEVLILLGPRATQQQAALLPVIQALSDLLTRYVEGRLPPPAIRGRAASRPYCARRPGARPRAARLRRIAFGRRPAAARPAILVVPVPLAPLSNLAVLPARPNCVHFVTISEFYPATFTQGLAAPR